MNIKNTVLYSAIVLFTACSSTKSIVDVDQIEDQKTIEAKVGEMITISMKENITTGYKWDYTISNDNLKFIKEDFVSSATHKTMVGAGGKKSYIFQVLKPGTTSIKFSHGRGWEPESGTIKIVNINIAK